MSHLPPSVPSSMAAHGVWLGDTSDSIISLLHALEWIPVLQNRVQAPHVLSALCSLSDLASVYAPAMSRPGTPNSWAPACISLLFALCASADCRPWRPLSHLPDCLIFTVSSVLSLGTIFFRKLEQSGTQGIAVTHWVSSFFPGSWTPRPCTLLACFLSFLSEIPVYVSISFSSCFS